MNSRLENSLKGVLRILLILLMVTALIRRREAGLPVLTPCSAAVLCYAMQAFFSFPVCLVAPMFWVVLGLSAERAGTFPSRFPSDRSKSKEEPTSSQYSGNE